MGSLKSYGNDADNIDAIDQLRIEQFIESQYAADADTDVPQSNTE